MQETIPEPERSPGGRNGNPLQYSCLENPTVSIGSQGVRHDWSDWACLLLQFPHLPLRVHEPAAGKRLLGHLTERYNDKDSEKVSSVCLEVLLPIGLSEGWQCSYWPVQASSTSCSVDLLGLSEGLKPASINQCQEMPTCMGFIRDDRPFSWEKDGDHPEI